MRRIVLVGRAGSGKSSTGNTIMMAECFKTVASEKPVTTFCEERKAKLKETLLQLVDTPGYFQTDDRLRIEILRCFAILAPGPHVILYVLQTKSYTDEEMESVNNSLLVFGGNPYKYTVTVFTNINELKCNKLTPAYYLKSLPNSFQSMRKKCGKRTVFLNTAFNLTETEEIKIQTFELFKVIKNMLEENSSSHYANEILEEMKNDQLKSFYQSSVNYPSGRLICQCIDVTGLRMIIGSAILFNYSQIVIGTLFLGIGCVLILVNEIKAESKASDVVEKLQRQTSSCIIL